MSLCASIRVFLTALYSLPTTTSPLKFCSIFIASFSYSSLHVFFLVNERPKGNTDVIEGDPKVVSLAYKADHQGNHLSIFILLLWIIYCVN